MSGVYEALPTFYLSIIWAGTRKMNQWDSKGFSLYFLVSWHRIDYNRWYYYNLVYGVSRV